MSVSAARFIDVPQFVSLPRGPDPAIGDAASVCAPPGLVGLLSPDRVLGSGYQAPLTVPFGIAVTASLGALSAPDPLQALWMVRTASIAWSNRASPADVITCEARVIELDERSAEVVATAVGSESGQLLQAKIRILPMREGRYAATAHAAQAREPRRVTHDAQCAMSFPSDALSMLMKPQGAHAVPVGRRAHPLGGAPLGAALTTALRAAGERDPDRPMAFEVVAADATWYLPLAVDSPFASRMRGTYSETSGVAIDVLRGDGRLSLRATVYCGPR